MIFPRLLSGYSQFDPKKDIPPLDGRVVLITGANTGLGYEAAKQLAERGAKVYLGARNEARGRDAVERIKAAIASSPSAGSVQWLEVDVSTPLKAKESAERLLIQTSRLDILVHNAGLMNKAWTPISQGVTISNTMATNHLGPFVLTQELLPLLRKTAEDPDSDVRIVVLSSDLHASISGEPDFSTLEGWNAYPGESFLQGGKRYNLSKLANVLFTRELQSRLNASKVPITCIAVHPGVIGTGGSLGNLDSLPILGPVIQFLIRNLGFSLEEGAYTSVFAAASPVVKANREKFQGAYLRPFDRISEPSKYARNKDLAEGLWRCSEELTEICLREGKSVVGR
ncbi:hypothetical protein FRB99_003112 [Tulasnella sp. 403]|nr:hypothetical protein FRB99_003112 [Tulasnella sp. 403]